MKRLNDDPLEIRLDRCQEVLEDPSFHRQNLCRKGVNNLSQSDHVGDCYMKGL